MFVFELPEVGEGVVEVEVVSWNVQVGDTVAVDQPLCEITTDKAQLEVSSPRAGTIVKLHAEPGDIVAVHAALVEIDESGAPAAPPQAPTQAGSAEVGAPPKAAPAVRRYAHQRGVSLKGLVGTGPSGRITRDDVDAAAAIATVATTATTVAPATAPTATAATTATAPAASPPAPAPPLRAPALPQAAPTPGDHRIKLVGIRRKIAEQMVRAKHTAAHFTYVEEIDATRLVELREQLKPEAARQGIKLTYIPFMMKACSRAFSAFPNLNAVMDEERFELVVRGSHDIGVAVDTPDGLFVPVVREVQRKSVLELAAELSAITARVRAGRAKLDELRGGSFTITSVGNLGGVFATPILNVPEVAILGVNMIRERPVVVNGQIVIRKMFYLSPSFDHRVIDGALGARFVRYLKDLLEHEAASLLLELP